LLAGADPCKASILLQRLGERGPVFLDDYISKRWFPDPGERHS